MLPWLKCLIVSAMFFARCRRFPFRVCFLLSSFEHPAPSELHHSLYDKATSVQGMLFYVKEIEFLEYSIDFLLRYEI